VCQLDLAGFESELTVISGRLTEVRRMERSVAIHGPDPANWLPPFMAKE
jgi:type IV secretion system protein VirB4